MKLDARNLGWLLVLGAALVGILMMEDWLGGRGALAPESSLPAAEVECGDAGVCSYRDPQTYVRLELGPQRRVMAPMGIVAEIEGSEVADDVRLRWRMAGMDMGEHVARLQPGDDGLWRGEVTLPVCASGHTGWIGRLEWGGQPVDFHVTLAP